MFKSTNPVFSKMDNGSVIQLEGAPMTVSGTITKVFILLLIASISGAAVIYEAMLGYTDKVMFIMFAGLIVGLITGLVTSFVPKLAKYLSPVYAFAEGAFLGGISIMLEAQFPGIAVQAVSGTFLAFFVILFLYKIKAIRATNKFRAVLMSALMTILVLYLATWILGFFHITVPFVNGSGPMSIVCRSIIVVVASLSLILDFDFIEKGEQNMFPKDYEWYASFGLLVTLVWLYIEILNLLAKLRRD
jgi:uncharacterized YccA/Bax inhibitor family protein